MLIEKNKVANYKDCYADLTVEQIQTLKPSSLVLLVLIKVHTILKKPFFPGTKHLAESLGYNRKEIQRSILDLKRKGYIEVTFEDGVRFLSLKEHKIASGRCDKNVALGDKNVALGDKNVAPTATKMSHHCDKNVAPEPIHTAYSSLRENNLRSKNLREDPEGESRGETKSLHAAVAAPAFADAHSGFSVSQSIVVANQASAQELEAQICPETPTSSPTHPKIPTDPQKPNSGQISRPGEQLPAVQKPPRAKQPKVLKYTRFSEHDFFWPDHWGDIGRTALAEWVDFKNKTNNPVLQESYQKLINQHAADETGFVADVNFSISSGYKGVFQAPKNIRKSFQSGKVAIDTAENNKYAAAADWARSLLEDE